MTSSGDDLVSRLLSGGDDTTANELLNAIFRGYPADSVRQLVRSDVPEAVKAGAWILSELGSASAPLLASEVTYLLDHELRNARFFALDAVLASATAKDGAVVGKAVTLIRDEERAVRWKAMQFLSRAGGDVLASGIPFILDPEVKELTVWLVSVQCGGDLGHGVEGRLEDADPVRRLVAAAAAARLSVTDPSAIECAAEAADDEVRDFAREEMQSRGGATSEDG